MTETQTHELSLDEMDTSLIPKPVRTWTVDTEDAGGESCATGGVIRSNDFTLYYGKTAGIKNITMDIYARTVTAIIGRKTAR